MSIEYSHEQIVAKAKLPVQEETPRTDVSVFTSYAMTCLTTAFNLSDKDEAKRDFDGAREYLAGIYNEVVWDGGKFKKTIPNQWKNYVEPDAATAAAAKIKHIPGYGHYAKIKVKTMIFMGIVKGTVEKATRSSVVNLTNKSSVMMVTHKMACAVISILCSGFGINRHLQGAQLGNNIFLGCSVEESQKNRWGIHYHAGINFVAKYCYDMYGKAKNEEEARATLRKNLLPQMEALIYVAFRMDENNKVQGDEANTVKSLIQATGMSIETMENFISLIDLNQWAYIEGGRAGSTAKSFFKKMKSMTRAFKKTSFSDEEYDDEYEDEEEGSDAGSDYMPAFVVKPKKSKTGGKPPKTSGKSGKK